MVPKAFRTISENGEKEATINGEHEHERAWADSERTLLMRNYQRSTAIVVALLAKISNSKFQGLSHRDVGRQQLNFGCVWRPAASRWIQTL